LSALYRIGVGYSKKSGTLSKVDAFHSNPRSNFIGVVVRVFAGIFVVVTEEVGLEQGHGYVQSVHAVTTCCVFEDLDALIVISPRDMRTISRVKYAPCRTIGELWGGG
jgi:hypothetical protein